MILIQRAAELPAPIRPPYRAARLDLAGVEPSIVAHLGYAWSRWRSLVPGRTGTPLTLFDRVVACADYIANLCKHPYRHAMASPVSDPRCASATPLQLLAALGPENQSFNGAAWVPAAGKTLLDAVEMECTWQHLALGCLVNGLGAQWALVDHQGHTAFAYYDAAFGKWVWVESTYNEHYRWAADAAVGYVPLSPLELHEVSVRGAMGDIVAVQHPYQPYKAGYPLPVYKTHNPNGWSPMAVTLDGRSITGRAGSLTSAVKVLPTGTGVAVYAAQITAGWAVARSAAAAFPPAGECHLVEMTERASGAASVRLRCDWPGPVGYQRKVGGGAWAACGAADTVQVPTGGEVRYRATLGEATSGEVVLYRA